MSTPARPAADYRASYAVLVLVCIVAALIAYKGSASFKAIDKVRLSGALSTRTDVVAFSGAQGLLTAAERSIRYFAVIWPALAFGVLIAATVRAFIPKDWFARILSARTLRAQITAGAAGASLMLCSCCVAPVFGAVYERSSRLGPSLAVMLASPSLNPAAMVLTFMLFAPKIAVARLLMAGAAVCLGGIVIDRLFPGAYPARLAKDLEGEKISAFLPSLFHVLVRTIPALVLGVLCSTVLTLYVPKELFQANGVAIIATASIAVPLAVPTFFEIPLALGLLAAGAPAGAAAALLFAGPAVNLPSLLALAKSANRKVAVALAASIWWLRLPVAWP